MARPTGEPQCKDCHLEESCIGQKWRSSCTPAMLRHCWENLWERRPQCEPQSVAAGGCQLANIPCKRFSLEEKTEWLTHSVAPKSNKGLHPLVLTNVSKLTSLSSMIWTMGPAMKQLAWVTFSCSDVCVHILLLPWPPS